MFDLNEPADDAAAAAAAPAAQEQEVLGDEEEPKMIKPPPPQESEVAVAEAVLSLMAPVPPQQEILHQLDSKPSDECRGLSPVSEEDKDDDNVSSAAKQWSLRTLPEEDACINITSTSSNSSKQERSSSWPRSERPATVMRSGSFHMLFDDRPNSADPPPPPANNVDCSPENGRLEEAEELVADHEQQYPKRTAPENSLCEFLPLITPTTAKNGNSEVVTTDHEAIDLIDVFGVRREEEAKADDPKTLIKLGSSDDHPPEAQEEQQQQGGLEQASRDGDEAGEEEGLSGELAVDEARFGRLIWQGRVNFRDVTVNNMVAACAKRWEYVFGKRKLPDLLKVQRFLASTDKFVCAVKDCMAEPAIKMIQKSGSSSQNLNKLVQVLVGGGTGIDSDLSLHAAAAVAAEAAASFKGPLVAVIPLQDEGNVWLADLYLLAASVLSDVEPGELSLTDEGVLYGFLAASPTNANSSDESFTWLKDGNRPEVETTLKSSPSESKNSKKPRANGEAPVEKRGVRSSSEMSGDYKQQQQQQQELEEGQLVSEDLGVKETTFLTYERRKRYTEDEKKAKLNGGETEAKTRDRSHRTHRDHERDRDQERERTGGGVRRDRDGDAGNHRERDREGVYTRRGNHDYLPRLDTKSIRHREGDKERRDAAWENGGGGGTTSRGPSTRDRRSRSKEREKERERSGDKSVKEPRSSKAALKIPVVADLGKVKIEKEKKRDRSPMDSYRGNGKRPKDGPSDDPKAGEKLAALPENKLLESDFPTKAGHNKDKDKKTNRHESEERSLSSSDLKNKGHTSILVDEMENEVFVEMFVESCDQDTRSWLASKQNAIFLREDYGITLLRKETSSTDLTKMEQPEALHLKLSGQISENCDISEAKYFVARAANVIKEIARRGVFLKSLWYPGPVQPYSTDAPPVHMVVRKLKGDDGKNLDRIQDATGIMVGIILDADNKKAGSNSKTSVVGIRLRSSRKKGLTEATKKCRDLLQEVAASFAKEMDIIAKEKENAVNDGKVRPLYVSQLPEYASARMLRAIFENVLREKLKKETEHPPGFEQSTDMVSDVKYASEEGCAFVEFASDDLLEGALQLYAADKDVFCGLKVELPTPAAMRIYEQLLGESESAETKLLKAKIVKDVQAQISDSEDYMLDDQTRPRKAVKPLFLTELIRAATSDSVKRLFEEIIATHINPSLDGKSVLAVRHIPTRGCMFVDLATPELVEFMLELHTRKPDVFGHMKMELGRSHAAHDGVDRKRSFSNLDRSRSERNLSPRPKRRATDNEEDLEDGFGRRSAKQRSDPEKTVYADHLPENSSDMVIRKIFRTVLLEHMSAQQRAALGEEVVTEVRHVRMKYCAFVVFVSEELARLALELYSRDEEIFDHMRLKPHFNSRLEDIYKEDGHENNKDDDTPIIFEHGGKSELDFQDSSRAAAVAGGGAGGGGGGGRGSGSSSRGFKEVDRRRSVYVDRIPDKYPETAIKEVLDKFLRRKGRGSPSYVVSHVSFFRDKYDPSKLCAFVEVKNEDAVQDLLDCYADDEGAFDGMRIRPAVKYN